MKAKALYAVILWNHCTLFVLIVNTKEQKKNIYLIDIFIQNIRLRSKEHIMKRYKVVSKESEARFPSETELKESKKNLIEKAKQLLDSDSGERVLTGGNLLYFWIEAAEHTVGNISNMEGVAKIEDAPDLEKLAEEIKQRLPQTSNGFINLLIPPKPL